MILSTLLRRGRGPRLDVGVAPLEAPEWDWRPKPLDEIVAVPLAPADEANTAWQGRPGERKPLWAILGNDPPFGWQAPEESEAATTRHALLASNDSPVDKPTPEALPGNVSNAVINGWAAVAREQGEPGLYVTGHPTFGVGPTHTAIEYIAEDGTRQWISARPNRGQLQSREDARSDRPDRNFTLGIINPPDKLTHEEYYHRLKDVDQAYGDRTDYDLFPEIMDGYNSNSYVRGLLDHTAGSYSVDFDKLIGGGSPLPSDAFDPEWPGRTKPLRRRSNQGPRSIRRR